MAQWNLKWVCRLCIVNWKESFVWTGDLWLPCATLWPALCFTLRQEPEPVHLPADLQTWTVLGGPDCVVYRVCRLPYILHPALVPPTSPRNQMVRAKQPEERRKSVLHCILQRLAKRHLSRTHPSQRRQFVWGVQIRWQNAMPVEKLQFRVTEWKYVPPG